MPYTAIPGRAIPGRATPGWATETAAGVTTVKVITEAFGLTDSAITTATLTKVIAEQLGLADAVLKGEAKVKVFTETLALTDTLIRVSTFVFTSPTEARAFMAATTRENDAARPDFRSQFVTISAAPGAVKRGFVNVARDVRQLLSEGVVRAELNVYFADDPAGSDVTVAPIDEDWSEATVTHNAQPLVRSAEAVTVALSGAGWHSIDITSMVAESLKKTEALSKPWNGVRIVTDSATDLRFYSDNAADDRKPYLKIEPNVAPFAPTNLAPSSGKFVSSITPKFVGDFNDPNGDDTVTGIHFLLDTDETFETPLYDSGEVAHDSTIFDSTSLPPGAPAWPTLYEDDHLSAPADGYFFMKAYRDNHGAWSPLSAIANFRIKAKPALSITTLGGNTQSPLTTVEWTMSDQQRREVIIEDRTADDQPWEVVYREPTNPSTSTSFAPPTSAPHKVGVTRRITVRGWDSYDRDNLPGDPAYSEDSITLVRTA